MRKEWQEMIGREFRHLKGNLYRLEGFAGDVIAKSGKVDVLVNNAMPLFKGIDECTYEEFARAQAVGETGARP